MTENKQKSIIKIILETIGLIKNKKFRKKLLVIQIILSKFICTLNQNNCSLMKLRNYDIM